LLRGRRAEAAAHSYAGARPGAGRKSLSEAIEEAGVFSKVYSTAILAGEKSGNLSGVLEYYIAYQKVSTGVKKKIVASLVYSDFAGGGGDVHCELSGDRGDSEVCAAV